MTKTQVYISEDTGDWLWSQRSKRSKLTLRLDQNSLGKKAKVCFFSSSPSQNPNEGSYPQWDER